MYSVCNETFISMWLDRTKYPTRAVWDQCVQYLGYAKSHNAVMWFSEHVIILSIYLLHWPRPVNYVLIVYQIMACRFFVAKPVFEPRLAFCWLHQIEHISEKFKWKMQWCAYENMFDNMDCKMAALCLGFDMLHEFHSASNHQQLDASEVTAIGKKRSAYNYR